MGEALEDLSPQSGQLVMDADQLPAQAFGQVSFEGLRVKALLMDFFFSQGTQVVGCPMELPSTRLGEWLFALDTFSAEARKCYASLRFACIRMPVNHRGKGDPLSSSRGDEQVAF